MPEEKLLTHPTDWIRELGKKLISNPIYSVFEVRKKTLTLKKLPSELVKTDQTYFYVITKDSTREKIFWRIKVCVNFFYAYTYAESFQDLCEKLHL